MGRFGRSSEKDAARAAAYADWFRRQHPLALASLLLSAFSLTLFGTLWVDELLGIGLGVVTLVHLRRGRPGGGRGLAWAGVAVGLVSLACAVLIYVVLRPRG